MIVYDANKSGNINDAINYLTLNLFSVMELQQWCYLFIIVIIVNGLAILQLIPLIIFHCATKGMLMEVAPEENTVPAPHAKKSNTANKVSPWGSKQKMGQS